MKLLACFAMLAAASTQAADDKELVARFLQYRDLPRLTAEQIDIAESVQTMCRDPQQVHGPHIRPGIHLYASPVAVAARKKSPAAHEFPLGTLLVKEKFATKGDKQPDVITVMEKIANSGTVDDWQFHMIRLADHTVVRTGFEISCTDCHSSYRKTGFVSRQTSSLLTEYVLNGAPKPNVRRK